MVPVSGDHFTELRKRIGSPKGIRLLSTGQNGNQMPVATALPSELKSVDQRQQNTSNTLPVNPKPLKPLNPQP